MTTPKVAIPTSSEELAELLTDDKKRAAVFADADSTKSFLAAYAKAQNKGGELAKQVSEQVQAGMIEFLKESGVANRPDQSDVETLINTIKPGTGAQRNAAHNPQAPGAKGDGVVNDLGEFARLINPKIPVRNADEQAKLEKLIDVRNAYSSVDPSAGGFLIPEEMRSEIISLALESSVVRSKATVVTMGSLTQSIPFVDASTNQGSVFGGLVFYWTPESGTILSTESKFGRVKLEANKLTGGARVPNELWADAPALSSWLMAAAPAGLAFYEDLAFLTGNGVGQPLGVYNSPAVITVTKETGQAADTIVAENIFKMYSRMLPQSLNRAVWTANQTAIPQLLSLSLSVGVGGTPISLVNIHATPELTLLGRPLIITEKNPVVGDAGDIAFVDFSQYLIGDRQAVSMDSSEHSRFMNDETELRIISRVDGRPWVQSAMQPLNGDTVSPFIKLGARA